MNYICLNAKQSLDSVSIIILLFLSLRIVAKCYVYKTGTYEYKYSFLLDISF